MTWIYLYSISFCSAPSSLTFLPPLPFLLSSVPSFLPSLLSSLFSLFLPSLSHSPSFIPFFKKTLWSANMLRWALGLRDHTNKLQSRKTNRQKYFKKKNCFPKVTSILGGCRYVSWSFQLGATLPTLCLFSWRALFLNASRCPCPQALSCLKLLPAVAAQSQFAVFLRHCFHHF